MSHFFALLSRMRYISRWGLMRNTVSENIAEHSLMTAAIAHCLAVIRRDVYGGDIDPGKCAVVAIYHDAPEIFTGDMPTPVKYFTPELREEYAKAEDRSAERLLSMLPGELRTAYETPIQGTWEEDVRQIIHAADKLSAYIKCLEETAAGNNEFSDAMSQTLKKLEEMELPEVKYFLDVFSPSFRLTLDKLQ